MRRFAFVLLGWLLGAGIHPAHAAPVISEFMPANTRTLADEDGEFPDWIEIHNPESAPVNLEGYYLSDDPELLTKWSFPAVALAGNGYRVVFASGKNRTADPGHLHTNFRLDGGGGFLALVLPDGVTVVSAYAPAYPPVRDDVSFGLSQANVTSVLLRNTAPQVLVPATAEALPADWYQPGFTPGNEWLTGVAPPALGFDTNQPAAVPSNVAPGGTAVQSTTAGAAGANLAINGSLADATQTLSTDPEPFWQVTLPGETAIHRVVLRNRTFCCGSRLRDITVDILSTLPGGTTTNYTSVLLNPENTGFTYPNGPASLEVDLVALTGGPVFGTAVLVRRTPDPDLSGSGGQGTADEAFVLALAEVEVVGTTAGVAEVNLARTGAPLPTATQSSTLSGYPPNLAIDGSPANFTHTLGTDPNPTWTLDLKRRALIRSVTLHNRDSCCGSRLRDITVQILAPDSNTVVYTSPLLNPENEGYVYDGGPDHLVVDLSSTPVAGQFVRVRRTPDPDLSGTGGQGNSDEAAVLSLGEVIVLGTDIGGYRPYVRTDLAAAMLGQNASAFVRLPFLVTDPSVFRSLSLRLRYDDGFEAYLNGVKVTQRNAPPAPGWDAAATVDRDVPAGVTPETIDLTAFLSLLVAGPNVLAFQAMNSSATDANFLLQPELNATQVVVTTNVFFADATPGAPNQGEYYFDEVADTQFTVDRGFFEAPFLLEITTMTPGASIYYSFNGDEPAPGKGFLYTGPLGITNTSVVRARAFKDQWKPSNVDTHSYLFLGDVIYQAADWPATRIPPPGFPASWGANSVDYGMDPDIVSRHTLEEWKEALTQVPTMSIVTEMGHLFDATTGIYANASGHGIDWERPMSLELLDPAAAPAGRFQENCGLRIRGGFSRNPQFVKHSFRVFFRAEYGAAKLSYPLFESEGANEFDTFDLRTSQNYSWPRESDYNTGSHETMVREVFCRETLGAMGQPYRRSRYYHLYVNGQYWGLYETDERPEAAFGATYLGGSKEDYDVVKCGNRGTSPNFATEATDGNLIAWSNLWTMTRSMVTDASNSNYFRILGRNPDGTRNPALPVMIDVDNLIDYMLEIFYSGDGDATLSSFLANNMPNNWFGMRDRTNPDAGFRFFNSDCEHTLGSPNSAVDRTGPFGGSNQGNFTFSNPQWMHEELMRNAEYRVRFADHAQRHFFNGGALTVEACTNRFLKKTVQITKAMRAYSARWGDAVRPTAPYVEADWQNRISNIVTTWFPPRAGIVLQQLRLDGLYPSNAAPQFSQLGGNVPAGYGLQLTHTNSTGVIYYSTDGTDPRALGGGVSPSAQAYALPITINAPTQIKARVLIGNTWSALIEAVFFPPQDLSRLLVTEIMYHPPDAGPTDGDNFEFIELKNAGPDTLNLSGLRFTAGINYIFPPATFLGPGQFLVLVRNSTQFASRYPGVAFHGNYSSGGLANDGETLTLSYASGTVTLLSVTYDDSVPWPLAADGLGFSLVPTDPNANPDPDQAVNWRASALAGGSPGADDPEPNIPPVRMNEALTRSSSGPEFIELFNPTTNLVALGGWFITDDASVPKKFRIPDAVTIGPLGYLVFDQTQFDPLPVTTNNVSLRAEGGEIHLFSGDANTNLTGYSHGFTMDGAAEGVTFGRYVISTGEENFPAQLTPTPDQPNSGPRIGPVVISEIQYHPAPTGDEFVELRNITDEAVLLYDPARPTNTWRLNGLGLSFPPNLQLAPQAWLLLVAADPAGFRAKYGVPADVAIVGPYPGTLQDSGERLELQRPELVGTNNALTYITVDAVRYNDRTPWPPAADGSGPSLQRKNLAAYGNDSANWEAANATVGFEFSGGEAPTILAQPQSLIVVAGQTAAFSVAASGPPPLSYQWRFNNGSISGATSSNLTLTNVKLSQAGNYTVVVFNDGGSAASVAAVLTVRPLPTISGHPLAQQTVKLGSNVTFSVSASGTGLLFYQWRLNQQPLLGQTNQTLVINPVERDDDGIYDVVVTDDIGSIASNPARLTVLIPPTVLRYIPAYEVVQGGNVTLSIEVDGTIPMGYRWRRRTTTLTNRVVNANQDFYTVTNVQPAIGNNSNAYTVILTNAGNATPGVVSPNMYLLVLADADGDRLPDAWEQANGLLANDPSDAVLDADGDGLTNGEEYIAGTDPNDGLSYLKIDRAVLNGTIQIEFRAVSNTTYTVQYRNGLEDVVWKRLADVVATPSNRIATVTDDPVLPRRVYRLATPRQP